MTENPAADTAEGSSPSAPGRGTMPWLLVGVLIALFAVLAYAVVMVIRMLA
ncbi:MAG: hypothetical protein HOV66_27830 [Streptomycetaceae bacterium]|uniref:Uncharacterized protein n=1 Tax=Yinghuangia aomiensis TaxID=676205 RepID=A0ABP9H4V0_9ACTN|nr:hypothetical protein [Streptomycetaceae bacterium]